MSDPGPDRFTATYQVVWADLDALNHLANTRYLDYAAQTRFAYFDANGFSPADFARHRLGPVVLEDRVTYRRELRFLDRFSVDFSCAGLSADRARFRIVNRVYDPQGELCCTVHTAGGWFDLEKRRIVTPPQELRAALEALAREPDFEEIRKAR